MYKMKLNVQNETQKVNHTFFKETCTKTKQKLKSKLNLIQKTETRFKSDQKTEIKTKSNTKTKSKNKIKTN